MKFDKGNKRGRGRPKGSPNKTTASIKQAMMLAFEGIGGVPALIKWAKTERTEFYKLWIKLLPQDRADDPLGQTYGDFSKLTDEQLTVLRSILSALAVAGSNRPGIEQTTH